MSDMEDLKEVFKNIENRHAQKQEEQRREAMDELVGVYRRMWREMRAALLDEGVPEVLVDEATLSFIRLSSRGQ